MSRPDMPVPVAKRLGYALKRAQHALRVNMDAALKPIGLTMAQYAVMCALEAEPGMSNARLARATFVTAQTMQGVLSNLERAGFVERTTDARNARIRRGELTHEGEEILRRAHSAVAAVEEQIVASIGREASGQIAKALYKCAQDLEAYR